MNEHEAKMDVRMNRMRRRIEGRVNVCIRSQTKVLQSASGVEIEASVGHE